MPLRCKLVYARPLFLGRTRRSRRGASSSGRWGDCYGAGVRRLVATFPFRDSFRLSFSSFQRYLISLIGCSTLPWVCYLSSDPSESPPHFWASCPCAFVNGMSGLRAMVMWLSMLSAVFFLLQLSISVLAIPLFHLLQSAVSSASSLPSVISSANLSFFFRLGVSSACRTLSVPITPSYREASAHLSVFPGSRTLISSLQKQSIVRMWISLHNSAPLFRWSSQRRVTRPASCYGLPARG